ncbi:MAG TPA: hypothetical protein DEA08_30030 [Planctomycetes bacterium]|nr:hypothetical protein [Planctomycetota bacterium]
MKEPGPPPTRLDEDQGLVLPGFLKSFAPRDLRRGLLRSLAVGACLGLLGALGSLPLAVSLACLGTVFFPLSLAQVWLARRTRSTLALVLLVTLVLALGLIAAGAQYHYLRALLESRQLSEALAGSWEWLRGRSGGNVAVLLGPWIYLNIVVSAALLGRAEEGRPWDATRSSLGNLVGCMGFSVAGLMFVSELIKGRGDVLGRLFGALWAGICIAISFGIVAYPSTFVLLFVLLIADWVEGRMWPLPRNPGNPPPVAGV